jgi:hypothetical protein
MVYHPHRTSYKYREAIDMLVLCHRNTHCGSFSAATLGKQKLCVDLVLQLRQFRLSCESGGAGLNSTRP